MYWVNKELGVWVSGCLECPQLVPFWITKYGLSTFIHRWGREKKFAWIEVGGPFRIPYYGAWNYFCINMSTKERVQTVGDQLESRRTSKGQSGDDRGDIGQTLDIHCLYTIKYVKTKLRSNTEWTWI